MLLTITYQGSNATDLGFLLHKNPQRPQEFELSHGKAYVFYPEADADTCTAALLLDIDPLDLARGKVGSRDGGLFDYVNDRPYVSSSFMSTAGLSELLQKTGRKKKTIYYAIEYKKYSRIAMDAWVQKKSDTNWWKKALLLVRSG